MNTSLGTAQGGAKEPSLRLGSGVMFDAIAERYDLLNRIISLGIDQIWRRRAVNALALGSKPRVLDVATGTADLAILIAAMHANARVEGVDPSTKMLDFGVRKVREAALDDRVALRVGECEALPFDDASFDGATIAFGIRNVADRPRGLAELRRVVRPGGRVVVLELSEPEGGVLGKLAKFHVHEVVPFVGGLLSGSREYRYLQASIAAFPPPERFSELMREAGLEVEAVLPQTFGVAHIFVGRVPEAA